MNSIVTIEGLNMVVSGSSLLQEPVSREVLDVSGAEKPSILLVGTPKATHESFAEFLVKAEVHFSELGVRTVNLHDYEEAPTEEEALEKIGNADAIWVTGGDTLKMIDFWKEHGIDSKIGAAALNGTVLSGGSAGMLAWMTQGHSDAMSYRAHDGEAWDYIFVKGLGYVSAVGCPHYDSKTEGALERDIDFKNKFIADDTLPNVGIGITNRAALCLTGGLYRVVQVPSAFEKPEVHILVKSESGLEDRLLPIQESFERFEV